VVLSGTGDGILSLKIGVSLPEFAENIRKNWGSNVIFDNAPFDYTEESLRGYLEGEKIHIKAVVQPVNLTPFTIDVHKILTRIPYGDSFFYADVADFLGKPYSQRPVGNACGKNQVLLIVPCHRVISVVGLGGFGAGIDMKKRLLKHENAILPFRI
jgi:O-6-methylguanine DNA methyltransferase